MNKSTSLEQLQNDDNQNELVNEILNEINGNSKMEQPQQQEQQQPQPQQPQQQQQQQEQKQFENEQPKQEETNDSQMEMNIENMLKDDSTEHFKDETTDVSSKKSSVFDMFKKPLVVGLLVALFSLPFVNNVLLKVLPSREFIVNNSTLFTTLLKFLLSALLYFSLERVW